MELLGRVGAKVVMALELPRDEDGQVLAEYAIIIATVAVVCIAILTAIGLNVSTLYSKISTNFPSP
jgi:Flp pilus assembly pilin Flp